MKKNLFVLSAFVLAYGFGAHAQQVESINQQHVTSLVKTLSADDMQGRASFTPYADKAADFIASEFAKANVTPFKGTQNYEQQFTVYRLSPAELEVKLGKEKISSENVLVSTTYKELEWEKPGHVTIKTIAKDDNFRKVFSELSQAKENGLVLVHPKHAEMFANYKRYMSRGQLVRQTETGISNVFILTDQTTPKKFEVEVENKIEELQLTNVVATIEGKRKDEFVVFSAHYDHIGSHKPIDGDTIANGADDNASGTSAMLTLAAYYKNQPQPERTLVFVAFAAEEIGGYGSRYFSEQLNPDQIVAMFNIEMVGKPSKFGPNSAYLTGFDKSDLGKLMQKRMEGTGYNIHPDPYPKQNLFYRSDNATLARLGVPAHTISSVQIDKDETYHTVDDEFEMLDMAHLTSMIKGIALGAHGVVYGQETPTRVDKTQVQ